jgi:hypothetical protein
MSGNSDKAAGMADEAAGRLNRVSAKRSARKNYRAKALVKT